MVDAPYDTTANKMGDPQNPHTTLVAATCRL